MGVVLLLAWEGMICIALARRSSWRWRCSAAPVDGALHRARRAQGAALRAPCIATVAFCALLPFLIRAGRGARRGARERARRRDVRWRSTPTRRPCGARSSASPRSRRPSSPGSLFHRIGIPRPHGGDAHARGRRRRAPRPLRQRHPCSTRPSRSGPRAAASRSTSAVDPDSIGSTLDRHVRVGGEYFDVLEGRFRIEPAARGVVLHLRAATA